MREIGFGQLYKVPTKHRQCGFDCVGRVVINENPALVTGKITGPREQPEGLKVEIRFKALSLPIVLPATLESLDCSQEGDGAHLGGTLKSVGKVISIRAWFARDESDVSCIQLKLQDLQSSGSHGSMSIKGAQHDIHDSDQDVEMDGIEAAIDIWNAV